MAFSASSTFLSASSCLAFMSASCCSSCRLSSALASSASAATRCACSLLGRLAGEVLPSPDGGKGGAPEELLPAAAGPADAAPFLGFDVLHGAMTYLSTLAAPVTRAYSSSKTRSSRAKRRLWLSPKKKKNSFFASNRRSFRASKDKVVGGTVVKGAESRGIPRAFRLQAGEVGMLPPCRMGGCAGRRRPRLPSSLHYCIALAPVPRFRALDVTLL